MDLVCHWFSKKLCPRVPCPKVDVRDFGDASRLRSRQPILRTHQFFSRSVRPLLLIFPRICAVLFWPVWGTVFVTVWGRKNVNFGSKYPVRVNFRSFPQLFIHHSATCFSVKKLSALIYIVCCQKTHKLFRRFDLGSLIIIF